MNILYVCGHDPREINFGGPQRTHLLWNALQNIGEVYTVCYYPSQGKKADRITAIDIINPIGKRSYLNRVIRKIWNFFDPEGKKILPIASEFSIKTPYPNIKFDIVVCRYIEPAAIFHLWNIAPLYIDIDDHPIQAFKTRDRMTLKPWQRPIALWLQTIEFHYIKKKITGGWIANPEQASRIKTKRPILPLKNIPQYPGSNYNINAERFNYIFSIGFMQYQPNFMGIDRFLSEIWPYVYKKYPNLKYYIGGKGAPQEYVKKWNSINGVRYLGFIANLDSLYENSLATIVAVDQGSGTCIKTLESMSHSRVCLSRPFGVRGIETEAINKDKGLFVFNDANDFLSLLEEKVYNAENRKKQETSAFNFIKEHYSEQVFMNSVKTVFNS